MAKSRNHYKTLELESNASPAEIKKSYRKLQKLYHPDKVEEKLDDPLRNKKIEEAKIKSQQLVEAYEILSDPKKRELYDAQQKSPEMKPRPSSPSTSFYQPSSILPYIQALAEDTGLSPQNVLHAFQTNIDDYMRLFLLRMYIINYNKKLEPALSVEEALATTTEKSYILRNAYPFIIDNHLTFNEAKKLTVKEGDILGKYFTEHTKAIEELRKYRESQGLPALLSPSDETKYSVVKKR